jgi:NAD(P)-dependent dehydrogenase (short-subunit alcohol dehydrogenase family)
MNTQYQKVAVITGASQGLGAGMVDAYRKLGYAVVATSRNITPSGDPGILTVQGDIADPATAERASSASPSSRSSRCWPRATAGTS